MNKEPVYIEHDFQKGWPAGPDIFYRCERCGDLLPSTEYGECSCRNVYVDIDAGRAGAADESKVRLMKKSVI
jgi:hypothetical protein